MGNGGKWNAYFKVTKRGPLPLIRFNYKVWIKNMKDSQIKKKKKKKDLKLANSVNLTAYLLKSEIKIDFLLEVISYLTWSFLNKLANSQFGEEDFWITPRILILKCLFDSAVGTIAF